MPMRHLLPLLLCLFAPPLAAQQATHACANVAEPAGRLACYDKAFPPPPAVNAAVAEKAQADFGLNKPRETLLNPGQTPAQADPERIESRVIRVDHGRGGQRSFMLENGQVWQQTESRSSGHVQAGDTVQVRKGLIGGYMLVTPAGVRLSVRRAR
ncbi:type VI secretion protein [Flavobacterium sp. MXW15]|uniref:Type VI secretion protein n=1 Tax=Xanthomonas chitinilytica TaxID=2989819 RepID=A0ABT3JWL8_9XANT|nr:type VI secretion protein [Xanthomonas sp. H13-6]MCW4455625.1 type VI secretion protein [Flavobacterium sp. MXW15]MCW4472889.1 type VI secretion protein [Xanthomonas sp. H13-6]